MAYLTVDRLWHGVRVPLLHVSLVRPRAQAQLATIAGHSAAKPGGAHGDLVVTVVAHHGGALLAGPVYLESTQARLLLTAHFDATPSMLDHLLADRYAQRRYEARGHGTNKPPRR